MLLDELEIKQAVSILALIVLLLTCLTILILLMCGCLSLYEFCMGDSRKIEQQPERLLSRSQEWNVRETQIQI